MSWSCSSTHSYVVEPIAIAPTSVKNAPNRSTFGSGGSAFSSVAPTSNSQSRELFSSAMNPSMLVAV